MKLYYAHGVYLYGTKQEERDIKLLEKMGFEIENPNQEKHQEGYGRRGMKYFKKIVLSCDGLAFRALPDGRIPAGVGAEIVINGDRVLIELPNAVNSRIMAVEETREYLHDVGQR